MCRTLQIVYIFLEFKSIFGKMWNYKFWIVLKYIYGHTLKNPQFLNTYPGDKIIPSLSLKFLIFDLMNSIFLKILQKISKQTL